MQLTNFEKWKLFTESLSSPDNYITFGFYYLIAAALQRRVWIGPDHMRLYPNLYVILVGEPGMGKGIVIKPVTEILKFHKLKDPRNNRQVSQEDIEKVRAEIIAEEEYKSAQIFEGGTDNKGKPKQIYDKPLLFPVAADATTYEALVKALSQAIRRINYSRYDEKLGRNIMDIYSHSSLCFALEEISSLFRKRTEDLVHLLIQAYDCGDYTYETKTQGKDRVKRCCLNFFGGTTPGFMQSTFDDQLLTEGFSSRTFFIFANKNRKDMFWIPDLRPDQKEAYADIVTHVEKLSTLYGRLEVKQEDWEWLEAWWKIAKDKRANSSLKLNPYYSRKKAHVLKLATAIHFAESTEMVIERKSFQAAIDLLGAEELNMHFALSLDNSNPLANVTRKVLKYLWGNGMRTRKELAAEFWDSLPRRMDDLDEIISHLSSTGKILERREEHPITKAPTVYYEARSDK